MVFFIIILHSQFIDAKRENNIEIFDPAQNKVIKKIQMDKKVENMVVDWINNIEDICLELNPITDDGYAIRFPLKSSIVVQNKWLNTNVREVYLLIPETRSPFLIIFGEENSPLCFSFIGDIDKLSKILDFELQ